MSSSYSSLTIDCQSHVFPVPYAELLTKNRGWIRVEKQEGSFRIQYGDLQSFLLNLESYDPQKKIQDMDRAGIDVSILSVNIPGPEALDPDLALPAAQLCNDEICGLCSQYRDRFYGLAVLPLQLSHEIYLAEYHRAIHSLHLSGVVLYSHIGGKPIDHSDLEPLYTQAEHDGIPLVLHPTVPTWGGVVQDYSMIPMIGLMVDHSIAMLRLILGGILERHPNLSIVHPHCGGVIPYLMPRIEEQTEVKKRGRDHIRKPPGEYYRKVYLDLVSPSPLPMEYVLRFHPENRLLFGSDHPWIRIEVFKQMVENLPIEKRTKHRIFGENAKELFRL
ncbi:MAG: amidohydrolase family protein [Spirochaetes bacterium]|nr:amidohydrolase family protein [Spirochaetota bacterium]